MFKLEKIAPATYLLPKEGDMRVPGLVIASEKLLEGMEADRPLDQVRNVATLEGIVGYSIAMPDIHWGYGFPIGGVAATDAKSGVISPGGVGYDINCGVRLAVLDVPFDSIGHKVRRQIIKKIYQLVPSGVGHGQKKVHPLNDKDYRNIATKGAAWSVELGLGFEEDLQNCESHGVIQGAEMEAVSPHAKNRGEKQLGTVGSGNHFVEIGKVADILDDETARVWEVSKGQTYILIHSGSRGFGHQVCQDTLNHFVKMGLAQGLVDRQLVAAPITSEEGRRYFAAMAVAANYAFNNRQQILWEVRRAFREVMGVSLEDIRLVYDVCHNIAKFEEYEGQRLCVHRKGATRAFGPGAHELAPMFQKTGQPVLVPGDMGTSSYLLVGRGNPMTWCSCCHGAGRARSRHQALKEWRGRDTFRYMEERGVDVVASSKRTVAEEMPDAYKDVDLVVEAVEEASLASRVARLKPYMVLKG